MRKLSTPFQTIKSLKGLKKGLGHPESACLCYKPGFVAGAKCKYSKTKGRWTCKPKRKRM